MRIFFWILTLVGGLAGAVTVIQTLLVSVGAPQQADGVAMGVAFVVIPYCMARAVEGLKNAAAGTAG